MQNNRDLGISGQPPDLHGFRCTPEELPERMRKTPGRSRERSGTPGKGGSGRPMAGSGRRRGSGPTLGDAAAGWIAAAVPGGARDGGGSGRRRWPAPEEAAGPAHGAAVGAGGEARGAGGGRPGGPRRRGALAGGGEATWQHGIRPGRVGRTCPGGGGFRPAARGRFLGFRGKTSAKMEGDDLFIGRGS